MKNAAYATVLLYSCLTSATLAQVSERARIKVFDYYSHEEGKPEQPVLFLQSRIERLVEQVFSAHPSLTVLGDLKVEGGSDKVPGTLKERADFWKTSGVLEFLTGEIDHKSNPPVIVSDVYIGEDKGSLLYPIVTIRSEMTTADYSLFHDLHCALTLYVLAMDADRLHADPGIVSQYLAEAKSLLGEPGPSDADGIKKALAQAVQDKLNMLKQGGGNQ
jgi:hypothetical protein